MHPQNERTMIGGPDATNTGARPVSGTPYQTTPDADSATPTVAWLETPDGARFPVGTDCSIGRARNNHIVLPNEKVSRCHAHIQVQELNVFRLCDLGSSNGTWVNGQRITGPATIFDQDRLRMGPFSFVFRHPDGPARSQTLPASHAAGPPSTVCWLLLVTYGNTRATPIARSDDPEARTRWLDGCQQIVEQRGGYVSKYFTDGFLAMWQDRPGTQAAVGHAVAEMGQLQSKISPSARIVLHHGAAVPDGPTLLNGGGISGPAVSFLYRVDHLADTLKAALVVSEPARSALGDSLNFVALGSHPVSGFDGTFAFFRI